MVLHSVFVTPKLHGTLGVKNEEGQFPLADYEMVKLLALRNTYSMVYLKSIRFNLAIPIDKHDDHSHLFIPYQFHLKWLDNYKNLDHESIILPNTMVHDHLTGVMEKPAPSTSDPAYTTFCTCRHSFQHVDPYVTAQYNNNTVINPEATTLYEGINDFYFFEMERNALVKEGLISELYFEVFFTNISGKRLYRYIPNVELEFDLY